jgi:hypothetical protein
MGRILLDDAETIERRRERRLGGAGLRVRVRPGHRLALVNVSTTGALLEGSSPLRPGSRVDVQLDDEAQAAAGKMAARVMRCTVSAIDVDAGVIYRSALEFDGRCDWVREREPPSGYALHDETPVTEDDTGPAGA